MIPGHRNDALPGLGIPRESGDDPFFDLVESFPGGYSPRERG